MAFAGRVKTALSVDDLRVIEGTQCDRKQVVNRTINRRSKYAFI